MLDSNTILMFMTASTVLAFAPGPDNIFVLTQSIVSGKTSGIYVTLGLCTGIIFHTIIVALGLAAIFQTSVAAFNILKFLGAAYLLFLSYKSFEASKSNISLNGSRKLPGLHLYRRGIIMNVTNPKVSIFFLAFLPQFTNPAGGNITLQLIFLGFLFIVVTFFVFSFISILAGMISRWLMKSENSEKLLNRFAGFIFASLALKLVFTER